jgi:hypothetical protein
MTMKTMKLNCKVINGLIPSEKVVRIQGADGRTEEIAVSTKSIKGNKFTVSEVGRRGDQVLVELPRESASGSWRMWVKA